MPLMHRYLVHSLRLSYLRNVDDPYGARIISLSSSYTSNPYIVEASLSDVHRWPELEYPSSPPISDDESEAPDKSSSNFPGATGLKHHQTIMGNRSGAFGLRVSGRRASTSKRASLIAKRARMNNEGADAPAALPRVNFINAASDVDPCPITSEQADVSQPLPQPALKKDDPPPELLPKDVPFVPKFKGAAEMEARRRVRMMARHGVPASMPKIPSVTTRSLNPDISSSDDEDGMLEDDNDDDYDLVAPGDDNMDEVDEFDPCGVYINHLVVKLTTLYIEISPPPEACTQTAHLMGSPFSQGLLPQYCLCLIYPPLEHHRSLLPTPEHAHDLVPCLNIVRPTTLTKGVFQPFILSPSRLTLK